jgi:hypothetical protein
MDGFMPTPYIGFGNDTLNKQTSLKKGDFINCPNCKKTHAVECGTSDGKESDVLLFYHCGNKSCLAGMNGKSIIGIKPDISGSI